MFDIIASPFTKEGLRGISKITFARIDYSNVNNGLLIKKPAQFFAYFKFKNPPSPL